MQHIPLINFNQYEFTSLEDLIEQDNIIRFIDAFVDKLELSKLGFTLNTLKNEGWPKFQYKKEWLYLQKTNKHKTVIKTIFFETKLAA